MLLCASRNAGKVLFLLLAVLLLSSTLLSSACLALSPEEVLVVANVREGDSLVLAEYYLRRRQIPLDQVVRINVPVGEHCSRQEYEEMIRKPVRQALDRLGPNRPIRCLVTVYGVPLAIRSSESNPPGDGGQGHHRETRAAVDSELALVLTDEYPRESWLPNPHFLGLIGQSTLLRQDRVLMVGRLDGPDPATVRRLVDDGLAAEQEGLRGRACFDARWPRPQGKNLEGYALYDASLHAAADRVRASGLMEEVRLDDRSELFQPGDCPQTALYSGWYSLARYIDAFEWVRGAIGFHIASAECATLKKHKSRVWCKRMLEQGVAAVIGPVYEPYVQGFPLPELFFAALTQGRLQLGEAYLLSLPYLSWQMVLIGDPLYRPFGTGR